MDFLRKALGFIRHLNIEGLTRFTNDHGSWIYGLLALIVFCETGLVVLPFLPGDSLLFAAGAVCMTPNSGLNPVLLGALLIVCAIAGDTLNYHVGKATGPRVMRSETSKWLNKKHLDKTHRFFEKYGGKTIIMARFVPIVRTFAPFVAGAGAMNYRRFILFNIIGGVAWVVSMMGAGMLFGQLEFVQKRFELVVIAIVFISVLPMLIEMWKARREAAAEKTAALGGAEAAKGRAKTEEPADTETAAK